MPALRGLLLYPGRMRQGYTTLLLPMQWASSQSRCVVAAALSAATRTNTTSSRRAAHAFHRASTMRSTVMEPSRRILSNHLSRHITSDTSSHASIYLKACWNDDDLEEGDIVKSTLTFDDIQEQALDMFGSADGLECFDGYDWRPLTPDFVSEIPSLLQSLAASASFTTTVLPPLAIRIPSLYDEDYGTENDFVKLRKMTPEQMAYMASPEQMQLYNVMDVLHRRLVDEGYTRHEVVSDAPPYEYQRTVVALNSGSVHQSTRAWILQQAAHDDTLRSVLVSQPRALRHVTEALHYPFWSAP